MPSSNLNETYVLYLLQNEPVLEKIDRVCVCVFMYLLVKLVKIYALPKLDIPTKQTIWYDLESFGSFCGFLYGKWFLNESAKFWCKLSVIFQLQTQFVSLFHV